MSSPTCKSPCGKRICVPTPRFFKWVGSVQDTSLSCSSHLVLGLSIEETVPFSWITQVPPSGLTFFSYDGVDVVRVSKHSCVGLKNRMLVVVFIQACTTLRIVSELVQYHKIQQMILDQSSSLFKFFCWKPIGTTSVKIWCCWKCQSRCALSFVGRVGAGNVVSICITMTLLSSSHCKRIQQSWCLPDVWLQHFGVKIFYSCCDKSKHLLLTLVLLTLTFSILLLCSCENNFHLGVDTKDEYHASNQHEHSLKFVVGKNLIIIVMAFLHTFWQSTNLRSSMHEQCSMTT